MRFSGERKPSEVLTRAMIVKANVASLDEVGVPGCCFECDGFFILFPDFRLCLACQTDADCNMLGVQS